MKKFLGAELFFETLYKLGIKIIFGLPGGYVLKIYDVMPSYSKKIKHILTRHEQAATHMADGFSRASGLPGIILCTSGPAATNTITGISTAYDDSVPVLIFTGQVPTPFLGSDAFQEADHIGITRTCTKHNTLVRKTVDLPKAIAEAFYISNTGRTGPVLVDMPKDVLISESEFKFPKSIQLKSYKDKFPLIKKDYISFIEKFKNSKKPLFLFGKGACSSDSSSKIKKILNNFKLPAVTSLLALGLLNKSNYNYGLIGSHGSDSSSKLLKDCDLLISIGCDLKKIVSEDELKNKSVININIDKVDLNNKRKSNLNIHCDSTEFLNKLLKEKNINFSWDSLELEELKMLDIKNKDKEIKSNPKAYVMHNISKLLPENTIYCSDFSYEDVNLQKFLNITDYKNNILSGGNGTPGYGFPAAIGATFSRPRNKVVSISSGKNFQFNMQEMIVAVEQKINLTIIVLNDTHKSKYKGPNYELLAKSFGVKSIRVKNNSNFEKNIKSFLIRKGVTLIEILI